MCLMHVGVHVQVCVFIHVYLYESQRKPALTFFCLIDALEAGFLNLEFSAKLAGQQVPVIFLSITHICAHQHPSSPPQLQVCVAALGFYMSTGYLNSVLGLAQVFLLTEPFLHPQKGLFIHRNDTINTFQFRKFSSHLQIYFALNLSSFS